MGMEIQMQIGLFAVTLEEKKNIAFIDFKRVGHYWQLKIFKDLSLVISDYLFTIIVAFVFIDRINANLDQ